MKNMYILSHTECAIIDSWVENHECPCRGIRFARGGETSIIFTPTSAGTIVEARCICGARIKVREVNE